MTNNLKQYEVDAVLISSKENKYYFANLYSSSGYVLWTNKNIVVFVDGRYYAEMKRKTKYEVILTDNENPAILAIKNKLKEQNIQRVGLEKNKISFQEYVDLSDSLGIECVPVNIDQERRIKNKQEISYIKKAADIATTALHKVIENIGVGMTEKEVENLLVFEMKKNGAQKESFDIIVASGTQGAFPHAKASDKTIQNNELITIDFGARYNEYCSDITRTIAMGNPNEKLLQIYEIVREAQLKAIESIRPGVMCKEIDAVARSVIEEAGYGKYFTHNLGHSIGIECHENPRFSPNEIMKLEQGMILTVEPGIYIEGLGGVRIEDDVLVTETGYEVLTNFTKDLIIR